MIRKIFINFILIFFFVVFSIYGFVRSSQNNGSILRPADDLYSANMYDLKVTSFMWQYDSYFADATDDACEAMSPSHYVNNSVAPRITGGWQSTLQYAPATDDFECSIGFNYLILDKDVGGKTWNTNYHDSTHTHQEFDIYIYIYSKIY